MEALCERLIKTQFTSITADTFAHIRSVLTGCNNGFENPEDLYEAIGVMLYEVSNTGTSQEDIRLFCNDLFLQLNLGGNKAHGSEIRAVDVEVPIPIEKIELYDQLTIDSNVNYKNDSLRNVDQAKLQKEEQKRQQKMKKRKNTVTTKPNAYRQDCEASAAQVINRKDKSATASKLTDFKIENFDVSFGERALIQGATISMTFGRRYGLVGKNGLGKTTLLKLIANKQLRIPDGLSVLHVEQEVNGDDTPAIESVLEADVTRTQLLKEEKRLLSLNTSDATKELSEVYAKLSEIEADKAPAIANRILAGLGFSPEGQNRPTKTFSGGWRMRLALARALFAKPDLLLLDEPTNMLDLNAIIWLEKHLQTWPSTILVVSHDQHFLDTVVTDIFHLHNQLIDHYKGNYENFIKTRGERLKNQMREWQAQQQFRQHMQEFIDKNRYGVKAALVQSKIKMLERLPNLKPIKKETKVVFKFPNISALSPPILQLKDVVFGYSKEKIILNKICLSANMDSRICIVGPNGEGKTTLLKLILGELKPLSGFVKAHLGIRFGYFSQHHVDQLSMNLSPVGLLQKKFPGTSVEQHRRMLGRFGISGALALQSIASLSGGQKSRVAFTVMCYPGPNFLVLDEPTNHLDVETINALSIAIQNYKGGLVLVSHNERLITNVCNEVWICRNGKVDRIEGGFPEYRQIVEEECL